MAATSTDGRVAGAVMVMASVGIILAMGHHPSGAHGGALAPIVHGGMIALLMLLAWGFLMFSIMQGLNRPLIAAGLLAYAVSLFVHIGAATINGFIVPAFANPDAPAISHDIFRLAWHSNQALAKLGVYMTGAAYVLWSIDLLSDQSRTAKLTGALGVVAGVVPAVLLASGTVRMDVSGAFLIYAIHVLWAALVGAMLWRRELQPSRHSITL